MSESTDSMQGLVVGAGGGIGGAVIDRWRHDPRFDRVWAVSRSPSNQQVDAESVCQALITDHSEEQIHEHSERVLAECPRLGRVVIALGTLHSDSYQPEKSLDALSLAAMQEVHRVNCILPMLWLAALAPGLRKNPDCRIAVLSARVGSISDNSLGGWYSYRSAKAALNMGLKSAAIEFARRAKGTKLVAFHPGTVDTGLSKPFQRGVPYGKLFNATFVAERLDDILASHPADGELAYLDWAGKSIPW